MQHLGWNGAHKRALITGGSRGIGREIVKMLSAAGTDVIFSYAQDSKAAEQLLNECSTMSGSVRAVRCNHLSQDELERLADTVCPSRADKLDYIVNNAGFTSDNPLQKMTFSQWHDVLQIHLNAAFILMKKLLRPLVRSNGSVVNISSIVADNAAAGMANYIAAKSAINGLTKALSKEWGELGVRINAVAPGFINTDIMAGHSELKISEIVSGIPLKRLGTASDVANLVMFLLSDNASYITGQIFRIDGGFSS